MQDARVRHFSPLRTQWKRPSVLCFLLFVLCLTFLSACNVSAETGSTASLSKNELAIKTAKENIEKHRRGDARITVLRANGTPVVGAKLRIRQIDHDFKFGCYLKIDDLAPEKLEDYERHFEHLFNYTVVGNYWDFIQTQQVIENWKWFDREIAISQRMNNRTQSAPVLWGTNSAGTPTWLPQTRSELLPVIEKRVRSSIQRGAGGVRDWEIVNEPLAPNPDLFAKVIGNDYIDLAFRWARSEDAAKRLLINEYGVFGVVPQHNYNKDKYFDLLSSLLQKRIAIDVIGIQAHANGEWYEPSNVAEQLDRYAKLGKPLQITEFSAQILNYEDRKTPVPISGSYRTGIWDDAKQAEFYHEFYTVAFGNPAVEAIVTWGLDDERAWLPGIGLIALDGSRKPAYLLLDDLINQEWNSKIDADTDLGGAARFRGFYGKYQVGVEIDEEISLVKAFELQKGDANEWFIHLRSK